MALCTGHGWDRVNYLHSSWHGSMFWTFDLNSFCQHTGSLATAKAFGICLLKKNVDAYILA